jgi:1,4-alpha-glucan branching enzyme
MTAGLKPRVLPSLLLAMADGRPRCDRELMEIVFSNRRVVQRRLRELHDQGLVHIAGWVPAGDSYRWRPQYQMGAGTDAPKPAPTGRTSTQRVREYRAKMTIEDKAFKDAKRRQKRRVVKRDPLVAAFFGSATK